MTVQMSSRRKVNNVANVQEKSSLLKKDGQDSCFQQRHGETVDGILGGRLKVIQKAKGYRFSVDAYLLSHFVYLKKNDRVLDMGTGSGVVAMLVAERGQCAEVVGVDVQEEMVDMARRSVFLNDLEHMIEIRRGDVREIETLFDRQSFDVVVLNPPYRKMQAGRMNPDIQKSVARHETRGSLADFIAASAYVLKGSGHVFIIYPAARMVELMFQMRSASIEPKRLKMVYSRGGLRGEFVLVEGIKGGGEELEILPPLFIYKEDGTYSDEMERLFRELSACQSAFCE